MASSSEPTPIPPPEGSAPEPELSKKAAKQEKLRKKQETAVAAAAAAVAELSIDPLADKYGDLDLQSPSLSGNKWTDVKALSPELNGAEVLITGHVQAVRAVSKKMSFLVLRGSSRTVQCVLTVKPGYVSQQMVKFSNSLTRESVVDVYGTVSIPTEPIKGTSQQVEIQVSKLYCVSRAVPVLPINIEDASRSDAEIDEALKEGKQLVRVNLDTRLDHRVLDLRTPASQAIFRLESEINYKLGDLLRSEGFVVINTPKLIGGTSEGGAAVFRLDYFGKPACLAQSPQLHKQMLISGDFMRVIVTGPVFRAENSFTHRHLCEFTGFDGEMVINEHYSEVMDVVAKLFVALFDHLTKDCQEQLEAIKTFTPLKYSEKWEDTLRLTFEEGVQMLKEAGTEVDPLGDLNTETEKKLGKLVREKYDTDFYILHRYPLAVRPFYTMPCYDDPNYSNSFDVFLRAKIETPGLTVEMSSTTGGEEIISGAQRIHDPVRLEERAKACGINVDSIRSYLDSFKYGVWRHGGFGVGLERVAMLFGNLGNIREVSAFPHDPNRLDP